MLRYIYILICILQVFCNAYIHGNQPDNVKPGRNHGSSENARDHESNKVVLDVASFIQNTHTEAIQDYEPYSFRNTKQNDALTQSDDYYESQINENVNERDGTDSLNTDGDSAESDSGYIDAKDNSEENEARFVNLDDKIEQNEANELLLNPEKKCAFKDMKIPFFSRKKYSKGKKNHKKLYCFNCANSYSETEEANDELKELKRKIKRAYGDLCPKCIKRLLKIHHKEKPVKNKTDHIGKDTETTTLSKNMNIDRESDDDLENLYFSDYVRVKRFDDADRERQLKELAEVEKKVNHVKITAPQFTKLPFR